MRLRFFCVIILVLSIAMTGCGQSLAQSSTGAATPEGKLKVLATTTMLGDVVRNVGGDAIDLTVLMPINADPHNFQPTPQDAAKVAAADVIFMNGVGLEAFLEPLLKNAGSNAKLINTSQGITLLNTTSGGTSEGVGGDPHVWYDPNNIVIWTQNIEQNLSQMDPKNASTYHTNAEKYRQALANLDAWVRQQVAQIPAANRKLVTDHQSFGYFANRYGFEQVGAIIPSISTQAEPSAQELAALEDSIRKLGVHAIFTENTVNPALAERVAEDTHTKLVFMYSDSLSDPNGPAGTYLDYVRFDVNEIVKALK